MLTFKSKENSVSRYLILFYLYLLEDLYECLEFEVSNVMVWHVGELRIRIIKWSVLSLEG